MTVTEQKRKSQIPDFNSREEEAHFWDTHSFADYWDAMKPIQVKFAKNLSDILNIRIEPERKSGN